MAAETYIIFEWSIENFSCWNNEIHGKGIISPKSSVYYTTLELFPKGLNGNEEHLKVCTNTKFDGFADFSFIGSDGSILCTQQLKPVMEKNVLELSSGPKFEDVVAQIRKNEDLYRDQLTLKFRIKISGVCSTVEYVRTKIDAFHASFKIDHKILRHFKSFRTKTLWLTNPLDEGEMGGLKLTLSKNQIGDGGLKIILALQPNPFKKKVLAFTRVAVLNNEEVVRIEEDEHLFREGKSWVFSNSLTPTEFGKEKMSLELHFKIISRNKLRNIGGGQWQYEFLHNSTVLLMPTNKLKLFGTSDLNAHSSKNFSNVVSNQSINSLENLSKDFMCLYQDQDFSDLQLKCDNASFEVHKIILSARSSVFKTMLSTDMKESVSNEVDITDLDPSTLGLFLTYLYTGTLEELQGESALKLYYAADKYEVPSLKKECADFLGKNASVSNVCDILSLADKHQDDKLIAVAHDFFLENFNEVLRSKEWKSFMKSEPLLAVETVTHFGDKSYVIIKKAT